MPGGGQARPHDQRTRTPAAAKESPHSLEQPTPARSSLLDRLEEDLVLRGEVAVAEADSDHLPVDLADLDGFLIRAAPSSESNDMSSFRTALGPC